MYRGRFGKGLKKITLDYVSSISDDDAIFPYDIFGSQAHVIMLHDKKLLSKVETKKILLALESLKKKKLEKTSEAEDIHELVESLVIKKTGIDVGGKIHTGRSRNDQVSVDIRMKVRDDINALCQDLLDTIKILVSLAGKHHQTIIPLYTHLQQAQAGVFSHYLLAYTDSLFRDLDRLLSAYTRVNESSLGAGPVGGTSLPINRQSTAKILGFKGLVENSLDATTSRDFAAEYVATLAILLTNLSRISEDFIIWSTSEFSFIELADEFASPSSVMPQKKNPDILELTRANTSQVIGSLTSVLSMIKGIPSGYNRDLQQVKSSIWSATTVSQSALLVIKSMLETISVNKKNMKNATEGGYLIALDLAEKLVKRGVPFRAAHEIIGQLVRTSHYSKKPITDISLESIKKSIRKKEIDPKQLLQIIRSTTIESSLQDRTSQGSSGIREQKRMIKQRTKKINSYRKIIGKQINEVKTSYANLSNRVRILTR